MFRSENFECAYKKKVEIFQLLLLRSEFSFCNEPMKTQRLVNIAQFFGTFVKKLYSRWRLKRNMVVMISIQWNVLTKERNVLFNSNPFYHRCNTTYDNSNFSRLHLQHHSRDHPQYNLTQTVPNPNVNDDVDEDGSEYSGYDDDFINNHVTESLNIARKLQERANRENIKQTDSGFNPPPPPVSADDQENATQSSFSPEIFIELVRQYPCIWNVKRNVYKDQTKKKIAWT